MKNIVVSFFDIDQEILFSKNPFQEIKVSQLRYIKPFTSISMAVDQNAINSSLDIPADLLNKNLIIEVSNKPEGSLTETKQYFASKIKTKLIEKYGHIIIFKPSENPKDRTPLPKTYIKVYSQLSSNSEKVEFFKDGYTDLAGRFNYAQVSGKDVHDIKKFAVFINHK